MGGRARRSRPRQLTLTQPPWTRRPLSRRCKTLAMLAVSQPCPSEYLLWYGNNATQRAKCSPFSMGSLTASVPEMPCNALFREQSKFLHCTHCCLGRPICKSMADRKLTWGMSVLFAEGARARRADVHDGAVPGRPRGGCGRPAQLRWGCCLRQCDRQLAHDRALLQ